jgi:hypothetical protein
MARSEVPDKAEAQARAQRHALMADRLDRLRRAGVPALCAPSFLAIAAWGVFLTMPAARWLPGTSLQTSVPPVAVALTLVSPVALAIAIVLSAVSSRHRPFGTVRGAWLLIAAAAGCTAAAATLLARHLR